MKGSIFMNKINENNITIMEKLMMINKNLFDCLNKIPNKDERELWVLTVVGNLLHDVSEDKLDVFLKSYKELRSEVCQMTEHFDDFIEACDILESGDGGKEIFDKILKNVFNTED
jgi:hypothetical protein